jgi:hypothetical protein
VLGAQVTGGSWSTMMNFDAMSRAGAAGRTALTEAAAAMMGGIPAGQLIVRDGTITDPKSKKSMSFADVVKSGKVTKTFSADDLKAIKLKTPDQYTMIGVSVPQLDIPSKTNGTAKYGIDVMLPGMVYGKVVTPPVRYGATVKTVDDSDAKKVPGFIKAVTLDDKTGTTTGWVVAVANTFAGATKAAEALKVTYDGGPNAKLSSESLLAEAKRLQGLDDSGLFFVKDGDTTAALGTAAKVLEAEYTTSINIHAPMEPMTAAAEQKGDIWHVYTGNQFATRSGAIAAGAAGVDPKFVVMHQMWLGGGFGRRLEGDMLVPAVQASKAVGKPVKIIYTRENDMTMDFSRPLTFQKIKAGLDGDGKLVAMNHDVVAAWPTKRWGIPAFLSPPRRVSCGRSRRAGRSGQSKAWSMNLRTPQARIRRNSGSTCLMARAPTMAARSGCVTRCSRPWVLPATAPSNCRKAKAWAWPAFRRRSAPPQAGPPVSPMWRSRRAARSRSRN